MDTTTGPEGKVRRPRRVIPWLAGLGIVATFGAAAFLGLLEFVSYLGDEDPATPTIAPEIAAGAGVVALIACLPRLSTRVRAWGWSLSGAVAYLTVASAGWLADDVGYQTPLLPLLAALSGGTLVVAGALLAYSRACARSAPAPAA
jgi:hypothetical protein